MLNPLQKEMKISGWQAVSLFVSVQKFPDPHILDSLINGHVDAVNTSNEGDGPLMTTTTKGSTPQVMLQSGTEKDLCLPEVQEIIKESEIPNLDEHNADQEVGQKYFVEDNVSMLASKKINLKNLHNPCEELRKKRKERRTSDRQMTKLLKTEDDNHLKKRPFEGLYGEDLQNKILEGGKVLLACAYKVLAQEPRPLICLPAPQDDASDEEGDA
ncbi:uncharacterized protein LOC120658346 [Panicum virgatum]|uniref:Uncharacterized protein n=1 Tax=Panicum virgatum TaxID=38727 RepID=A0A8T0VIV8_PANVG|nr:uncharacterized protein LOC120658346 [Panicum virgatum]KAG2636701.1 hypothetical protein PVAP13_2NG158200 [Panicum virgatum]